MAALQPQLKREDIKPGDTVLVSRMGRKPMKVKVRALFTDGFMTDFGLVSWSSLPFLYKQEGNDG